MDILTAFAKFLLDTLILFLKLSQGDWGKKK